MFTGIKIAINKIKYRTKNRNNDTFAVNIFDHERVTVGNYSYGGILCLNHNDTACVRVGNFVSIGPDVAFIPASDHPTGNISTFPYKAKIATGETEALSKGDIIVNDDVWIGYSATILSGVTIGQGAVIATGAVVTKDVPPYAIVGGVPAEVIRYRFSREVIDYLVKLDYSMLTEDLIKNHIEELYTDIEELSLEELKKTFDWFPKKGEK